MNTYEINVNTGYGIGGGFYNFAWKTETPTQEGWYWVVMDYQDPYIKVQVKHLAAGDPPRWLKNVTHWLGPIPPPEMPE
jgi:hypothetical protein